MNYRPGDLINYDGKSYQVIKSNDCSRCALHDQDCFSLMSWFGSCESNCREDGENIIFKLIKLKRK